MHANLLAPSDHISGEELRAKGMIVVTLASVRVEPMEHIDPAKRGQKKDKGIISFREAGAKSWILNKTNVEILKAVFGDGRCGKQGSAAEHSDGKCYQTDHWIGHKLALGATKQKVSGDAVDGIIVAACDVLTAPLDVVVKLRSKAPRTFTVRPPGGAKPPTSKPCDGAHPEPACGAACWLAGPEEVQS